MPGENENHRNISHHHLKEAQGHGMRSLHDSKNSVGCPPMPDGILGAPLNPDPHGRGPKTNPYMPESARRPRDEPREMRPPHTASPHRYAPETERQTVVVTPRTRP
jgi:hypothetical protein